MSTDNLGKLDSVKSEAVVKTGSTKEMAGSKSAPGEAVEKTGSTKEMAGSKSAPGEVNTMNPAVSATAGGEAVERVNTTKSGVSAKSAGGEAVEQVKSTKSAVSAKSAGGEAVGKIGSTNDVSLTKTAPGEAVDSNATDQASSILPGQAVDSNATDQASILPPQEAVEKVNSTKSGVSAKSAGGEAVEKVNSTKSGVSAKSAGGEAAERVNTTKSGVSAKSAGGEAVEKANTTKSAVSAKSPGGETGGEVDFEKVRETRQFLVDTAKRLCEGMAQERDLLINMLDMIDGKKEAYKPPEVGTLVFERPPESNKVGTLMYDPEEVGANPPREYVPDENCGEIVAQTDKVLVGFRDECEVLKRLAGFYDGPFDPPGDACKVCAAGGTEEYIKLLHAKRGSLMSRAMSATSSSKRLSSAYVPRMLENSNDRASLRNEQDVGGARAPGAIEEEEEVEQKTWVDKVKEAGAELVDEVTEAKRSSSASGGAGAIEAEDAPVEKRKSLVDEFSGGDAF